jgi:hypothetical protein
VRDIALLISDIESVMFPCSSGSICCPAAEPSVLCNTCDESFAVLGQPNGGDECISTSHLCGVINMAVLANEHMPMGKQSGLFAGVCIFTRVKENLHT